MRRLLLGVCLLVCVCSGTASAVDWSDASEIVVEGNSSDELSSAINSSEDGGPTVIRINGTNGSQWSEVEISNTEPLKIVGGRLSSVNLSSETTLVFEEVEWRDEIYGSYRTLEIRDSRHNGSATQRYAIRHTRDPNVSELVVQDTKIEQSQLVSADVGRVGRVRIDNVSADAEVWDGTASVDNLTVTDSDGGSLALERVVRIYAPNARRVVLRRNELGATSYDSVLVVGDTEIEVRNETVVGSSVIADSDGTITGEIRDTEIETSSRPVFETSNTSFEVDVSDSEINSSESLFDADSGETSLENTTVSDSDLTLWGNGTSAPIWTPDAVSGPTLVGNKIDYRQSDGTLLRSGHGRLLGNQISGLGYWIVNESRSGGVTLRFNEISDGKIGTDGSLSSTIEYNDFSGDGPVLVSIGAGGADVGDTNSFDVDGTISSGDVSYEEGQGIGASLSTVPIEGELSSHLVGPEVVYGPDGIPRETGTDPDVRDPSDLADSLEIETSDTIRYQISRFETGLTGLDVEIYVDGTATLNLSGLDPGKTIIVEHGGEIDRVSADDDFSLRYDVEGEETYEISYESSGTSGGSPISGGDPGVALGGFFRVLVFLSAMTGVVGGYLYLRTSDSEWI